MSFVNVYECVCVCAFNPFDFEAGTWDLIVLVPSIADISLLFFLKYIKFCKLDSNVIFSIDLPCEALSSKENNSRLI